MPEDLKRGREGEGGREARDGRVQREFAIFIEIREIGRIPMKFDENLRLSGSRNRLGVVPGPKKTNKTNNMPK